MDDPMTSSSSDEWETPPEDQPGKTAGASPVRKVGLDNDQD